MSKILYIVVTAKAVVLATAATVLAIPFFSQSLSWNHMICKLPVIWSRISHFKHVVSS